MARVTKRVDVGDLKSPGRHREINQLDGAMMGSDFFEGCGCKRVADGLPDGTAIGYEWFTEHDGECSTITNAGDSPPAGAYWWRPLSMSNTGGAG
jgi:hypothetical protein